MNTNALLFAGFAVAAVIAFEAIRPIMRNDNPTPEQFRKFRIGAIIGSTTGTAALLFAALYLIEKYT